MKISHFKKRYKIPNDHPLVPAIAALAGAYESEQLGGMPTNNEVKRLWPELSESHVTFLSEIAKHPNGIPQADLQRRLELSWQKLRGVHNGLARICERLEIEKPVRTVGYNAANRLYMLDPDVAATVKKRIKQRRT